MASFKEELQQTKEDITFLRANGPLMRALMMEGIREDFREKAKKAGPLKKLALKTAIVASYAIG